MIWMDKLEEIRRFVDYVVEHGEGDLADYAIGISGVLEKYEQEQRVDRLTGLLNGDQLELLLEKEIALAERTGRGFGFVMLDLVGLKYINDAYSRNVGDEYIKFAAEWLKENIRESDLVSICRYGEGADEFGVILRVIVEAKDLDGFMGRLRGRLEDVSFNDKISLRFAMGGTVYSEGISLRELTDDADAAMLEDKKRLKIEGYRVRD